MKPERIVSLVPSLTEALFSLGVGSRVVGRTRYCTQPPRAIGRVAKVGGTKKVDAERVLGLEPDLVVAVKEENTREDIEGLKEAGVPVFVGAPETIDTALEMLRELAGRVGAAEDVEEVEALKPEGVLLPDEPYPFSAEDLAEFYALDIPAAREDRIHLVDGKLLTWYGPRMASSLTQLAALLKF